MKRLFLGLAANYSREDRLTQLFARGREEDRADLRSFLSRKYRGEAILARNGRSSLALALKAYFSPGDAIIVNGFTCYAVYEAVVAAGLRPVFVDINKVDLNFTADIIKQTLERNETRGNQKLNIRGIIIQNTLGNTVDINAIESIANKYKLLVIEDLAHCAGAKYDDGREVGTVGVATALSFGKEKSIDTIAGGAVILRSKPHNQIEAPKKAPKLSDYLRSRLYPTFGAMARRLMGLHLGGALIRFLVKIHWIEKSADSRLDLKRTLAKFEARRALMQFKENSHRNIKPIREFRLVNSRDKLLKELRSAGCYFDGFWYEKPVSPSRYYQKTHFPEKECPNAVYVSQHIINIPQYYSKKELQKANAIIDKYTIKEGEE